MYWLEVRRGVWGRYGQRDRFIQGCYIQWTLYSQRFVIAQNSTWSQPSLSCFACLESKCCSKIIVRSFQPMYCVAVLDAAVPKFLNQSKIGDWWILSCLLLYPRLWTKPTWGGKRLSLSALQPAMVRYLPTQIQVQVGSLSPFLQNNRPIDNN